MEFRCRVATATGQITEATYVADSEARLRSELEEKGLYVLRVQGGGMALGSVKLRLPRRRSVRMPEFLIFNQELATLLKAGPAARPVARHPSQARAESGVPRGAR